MEGMRLVQKNHTEFLWRGLNRSLCLLTHSLDTAVSPLPHLNYSWLAPASNVFCINIFVIWVQAYHLR